MSESARQGNPLGGNAQIGSGGDMASVLSGLNGGQGDGGGGQDNNALLAQQQALMGLTGGQLGGMGSQGFDASGDSRSALMSLLTRQGFGGGGMGAGMMSQMSGMQMGIPGQQGFGGMAGFQGNLDDGQYHQQNAMMGMGAFGAQNTSFGGFSPAMGMMG
jgi:hypothetical protein